MRETSRIALAEEAAGRAAFVRAARGRVELRAASEQLWQRLDAAAGSATALQGELRRRYKRLVLEVFARCGVCGGVACAAS